MPVVIAVVGGKKSGKTTVIEILINELSERGYEVAAVKHIPDSDFTIDKEGKDTWKYARAGANMVIGVSCGEIATIEKTKSSTQSLKKILRRCRSADVVFLEGFRSLVAKDKRIYKIIVPKSAEEAEEDLKIFGPVLVSTGPCKPRRSKQRIPYIDSRKNPKKLVDLIEKTIIKKSAT